jgi:tetratricopeptide (TPR) repeat protein
MDLAARAYTSAIDLDPTQSPERPIRAAGARARTSDPTRAVIAKIDAVFKDRLDEADRRRLLKLRARIATAEGQTDDAAAVLEEIVALDPLDGEALLLLGQHHARMGDLDKAVFYYERAESLEAYEAEASLRHAQILVGRSRFQEALPLIKRAQELKPRDDVARYLEQVDRIARAHK